MLIRAQVAIYALRQEHLGDAVRDGFIRAAADGPQVMTVTVSSGCPEES